MEAWYYHYSMYAAEAIRRKRIAAVALALIRRRKREKQRRRMWVRQWIEKRNAGRGVLNMVHNELRLEDSSSYKNYLRMDKPLFEELLGRIAHLIKRKDTVMRQAISTRRRLAATLRFLVTGNTYQDLAFAVRIAPNTLSGIIPETLRAIVKELEDDCITCPNSPQEWKDVEEGYRVYWNFPHCVGAMDGKHINFRPARTAGSWFRNYKGHDSIILLALVDASYKFLYIDVGRNGRMNDASVFKESDLGISFARGTLSFPQDCLLPGDNSNTAMPYVITADDAFPLSVHLMKPFPSRGLTFSQRIFNYRLSCARRVVENCFGILANRFRVLSTTINLSVETVELITRACCVLHNFILARKPIPLRNIGGEETSLNGEFQCTLRHLVPQMGNNPTQRAKAVREHFMTYFNGVGAVAWQQDAVSQENY